MTVAAIESAIARITEIGQDAFLAEVDQAAQALVALIGEAGAAPVIAQNRMIAQAALRNLR